MTFGALVKQAREKQGLSHREVARRAGVSATTLVYIEHGQTQDPRLSLVVAIMEALGLRWRDLTRVDDPPRPRARRKRPAAGADGAGDEDTNPARKDLTYA
jgi:transcriptional regulator with XRE-family HTH domain